MLKITDGFKADIDKMQADIMKKNQLANTQVRKAVETMTAGLESQVKQGMRDTEVNTSVSYGKKHHHPSVDGDYPAPDTGTLMRSVTHDVRSNGTQIIGEVGTTLEYGKYLEYGTSKMKPRPFLSLANIKLQSWFNEVWNKYMGDVTK